MEANTWTLILVGGIVLALLALILIKNHRDRRDFYNSLNASDDLSMEAENTPVDEK